MRRTTKLGLKVGAVIASMTLVAGCSSGSPAASPDDQDLTVWFMRGSVSEKGQEWLKDQWAEEHDGAELTVGIQDWDGIVAKLQTALASPDQTPDLVEFGNTQVGAFSSAGALSDISDMQEELGGEELVDSLVASGTYEDTMYAAPFFAGSRIIFYNKDLFKDAGVEVPTALSEVGEAAIELQKANPEDVKDFSGFYLPAKSFAEGMGWVFTHDTNVATQSDDGWVGTLSTDEGVAALDQLQDIYLHGTTMAATATTDESRTPAVPYNAGRAGMFMGLPSSWEEIDKDLRDDTGVLALPGLEPGTIGNAHSGGSNIAIPAKSDKQDLSREALKLIFQPTFQEYFASEGGWVPGNITYADPLKDTEAGKVEVEAVENSVALPTADKWAAVEAANVLRDVLTKVAQGGDVEQIANDADKRVEELLN